MADFKILGFQNPQLQILVDFKILGFQNREFKILPFQNPEFKILAEFNNILVFQNPELNIFSIIKFELSKILNSRFWPTSRF